MTIHKTTSLTKTFLAYTGVDRTNDITLEILNRTDGVRIVAFRDDDVMALHRVMNMGGPNDKERARETKLSQKSSDEDVRIAVVNAMREIERESERGIYLDKWRVGYLDTSRAYPEPTSMESNQPQREADVGTVTDTDAGIAILQREYKRRYLLTPEGQKQVADITQKIAALTDYYERLTGDSIVYEFGAHRQQTTAATSNSISDSKPHHEVGSAERGLEAYRNLTAERDTSNWFERGTAALDKLDQLIHKQEAITPNYQYTDEQARRTIKTLNDIIARLNNEKNGHIEQIEAGDKVIQRLEKANGQLFTQVTDLEQTRSSMKANLRGLEERNNYLFNLVTTQRGVIESINLMNEAVRKLSSPNHLNASEIAGSSQLMAQTQRLRDRFDMKENSTDSPALTDKY